MSPRPRKTIQAASLPEAIKTTAWKQIAEFGAPSLSLRAIARTLEITAPAIYNYYPDRDALVTALIVNAFTSLSESQQASIQALPLEDLDARLAALGHNYREWALNYSQRYQLIFGTPVSGYHAPEEITLPAAEMALWPLIVTLQSIFQAGRLRSGASAPMTAELSLMFAGWSQQAGGVEPEVLYAALVIWSRVHGLVMMEIGGQMPALITDPGEVYRREIENIRIQYLVTVDQEI